MPLWLENVKDGEICLCAKFRFNVIIVARNIADKKFSLKKAPDPGLKHLENHKNVRLKTFNKILMRYLSDCVRLHWASSPGNLTGRINGVIL